MVKGLVSLPVLPHPDHQGELSSDPARGVAGFLAFTPSGALFRVLYLIRDREISVLMTTGPTLPPTTGREEQGVERVSLLHPCKLMISDWQGHISQAHILSLGHLYCC